MYIRWWLDYPKFEWQSGKVNKAGYVMYGDAWKRARRIVIQQLSDSDDALADLLEFLTCSSAILRIELEVSCIGERSSRAMGDLIGKVETLHEMQIMAQRLATLVHEKLPRDLTRGLLARPDTWPLFSISGYSFRIPFTVQEIVQCLPKVSAWNALQGGPFTYEEVLAILDSLRRETTCRQISLVASEKIYCLDIDMMAIEQRAELSFGLRSLVVHNIPRHYPFDILTWDSTKCDWHRCRILTVMEAILSRSGPRSGAGSGEDAKKCALRGLLERDGDLSVMRRVLGMLVTP